MQRGLAQQTSVCHRLEAGSLRSGWQFRPGPCSCCIDGGFLQEDPVTGWTPLSPDGLEGKDQGAPGRVCDGDPTLSTPPRPVTEGGRCEPMNLEDTTLPCTAGDLHGPHPCRRAAGTAVWFGGAHCKLRARAPLWQRETAERQTQHVARVPCHRTDGTPSKPVLGAGGACWSQTHR